MIHTNNSVCARVRAVNVCASVCVRVRGIRGYASVPVCDPRGANPPSFFGGPKRSKTSVRDYGRIECASQFGPCDEAGVQVRGAKRDGDARRRVHAACGV
jgi:hypothetical protein